jgi:hypothetical protein
MLQVSLLVIVANQILNTAGASVSYSTQNERKYSSEKQIVVM